MDYSSILEERGYKIEKGHPHPLGATPDKNGVNFSIFSEKANYIELLLFDKHDDLSPSMIISTTRGSEQAHAGEHDSKMPKIKDEDITKVSLNKTFHFWHVYVRGLKPGIHYAYRIGGPNKPEEGNRFDPKKVLMDPYAKGNNCTLWARSKAGLPGDNLTTSMRSVVIDTSDYNWEKDSHVILRAINENPDMSMTPLNKELPPELNETIIY
jgi:isoamylase